MTGGDANSTAPDHAPPPMDLARLEATELLRLYGRVLIELRTRGVIRSGNNPVADYAEWLAAKAFGLTLASKSTTGYDATDRNGLRYEIKARRLSAMNASCQTSALRGLEKEHFDFLVGIVFESDFTVLRACRIPQPVAMDAACYKRHVNGHVLQLNEAFWSRPGVKDVTRALRAAQGEA